ncbi:AAA family ATPase [Streptomyces sp. NPDC054919]
MTFIVLVGLWGDMMHLSRIAVSGFRASAEDAMVCDLPGRFSVLIGANGAGKTTLTDALYLAHTAGRFPVLPRFGSATLAPERSTRTIEVAYLLGDSLEEEGPLGRRLHEVDHLPLSRVAQSWGVTLSRRLGGVAAKVEGLPHDRVTSELACPAGRVGRMSLCPSLIRKSSARMSCGSRGTAGRA